MGEDDRVIKVISEGEVVNVNVNVNVLLGPWGTLGPWGNVRSREE